MAPRKRTRNLSDEEDRIGSSSQRSRRLALRKRVRVSNDSDGEIDPANDGDGGIVSGNDPDDEVNSRDDSDGEVDSGSDSDGEDVPGNDHDDEDAPGNDSDGEDVPGNDHDDEDALGNDPDDEDAPGNDPDDEDAPGNDSDGEDAPGNDSASDSDNGGRVNPSSRRPRKRARVSFAPAEDEVDSASVSTEPPSANVSTVSFRRIPYESLRDRNFEHLEYEEEDFQEATQTLLARPQQVGQNHASEGGIVEKIECINFMCHDHLVVNLGPLINFIVGHNGSGKSAILTALTLCLGAKASTTNRALNIQSLIKEGCRRSMIAVTIKNQGLDAYRQDTYGDSITIERHLSRSGGSSFKLKSAPGKIVSNKKSDVDEVADWYCLQVDNPLNILSQDNARQFLNSSTPTQKYKFFLQGVQLEQLDEDYKNITEMTQRMEDKLVELKKTLIMAEEELHEVQGLQETSNKCAAMREKACEYTKRMVWAQVVDEERELARCEQQLLSMDQRISEAENELSRQSALYDKTEEHLARTRTVLEELKRDAENPEGYRDRAAAAYNGANSNYERIEAEKKEARGRLKDATNELEETRKRLQEEKSCPDFASDNARINGELESAKARERVLESQLQNSTSSLLTLQSALNEKQTALTDHEEPLNSVRDRLEQTRRLLKNSKRKSQSITSVFGRRAEQLIDRISKSRSFNQKPIGPFGAYMTLLKPAWSVFVQTNLGNIMNNFAVTSMEDQGKLHALMVEVGYRGHIVVVKSPRIDPKNQPDPSYDTLLRVLRIENDLVYNDLIIRNYIDQVVLIDNKSAALEALDTPNVKSCLTYMNSDKVVGMNVSKNSSGDISMSTFDLYEGDPKMKAVEDERVAAAAQRDLAQLEQQQQSLEEEHRQMQQAVDDCRAEIEACETRSEELRQQLHRARADVDEIQDKLAFSRGRGGRVGALNEDLQKWERTRQEIGRQYGLIGVELKKAELQIDKCKKEVVDSRKAHAEFGKRRRRAEQRYRRADGSRDAALTEKNSSGEALDRAFAEKANLESKRDEQTVKVQNYTQRALQFAPERAHVGEHETYARVLRKYNFLNSRLRQRERTQGATDEEINSGVEMLRDRFLRLVSAKSGLEASLTMLKATLDQRLSKWRVFQRGISARTRSQFTYLLTDRAFRGNMVLDHCNKKLSVEVEPDPTQEIMSRRSTKTLSGGERSFASICLLLSIWEAMGSPIRCLDEFDVFMDAVNRTFSTNMLINAARCSVSRQFVLITPNILDSRVQLGKDVTLISLKDPREKA